MLRDLIEIGADGRGAQLPAALAHRRADGDDPRPDHRRRVRLLRGVDRQGPRQPQGGAADAVLRRAAHLGEVPRRRSRASSARRPARRRRSQRGRGASAAQVTDAEEPRRGAEGPAGDAVRARRPSSCSRSSRRRSGSARPPRWSAARRRSRRRSSSSSPPSTCVIQEVYGQSEDMRPDLVQPAGPHAVRQRRRAAPRRRGEDRRRRRDPRARARTSSSATSRNEAATKETLDEQG